MFWGLILKSNKKYTQTIEKPFHLSKASLDHASSDDGPVQVMYMHEENSFLLCTLQKGKVNQCSLDLNFDGDTVCFSTKGNGIVHLTGYLMDDEFNGMDGLDMDDEEDMSEEEEAAMDQKLAKLQKKLKESKKPAGKAGKQQEEDEEDSDEDEEGSDDDENGLDESVDAEEGSDEEDDDEEDEEEDDDSEPEEPPKKQSKTENGNAQNGKKDANKKDKAQQQNGDKKPQQKENKQDSGKIIKMQGGLVAQELKVGTGAEAKLGKKVQVYYEGRLKSNNKVFDSAKVGKGFKFGLGKGEVIKGWDLGISGMKVGGKRRLVIPPNLAYGSKGSPPVIPQNATLVFDVELKNVF